MGKHQYTNLRKSFLLVGLMTMIEGPVTQVPEPLSLSIKKEEDGASIACFSLVVVVVLLLPPLPPLPHKGA